MKLNRNSYIRMLLDTLWDNIRWAVVCESKLIVVFYVAVDDRDVLEIDLSTYKYKGIRNIITQMRNIEEIVYCIHDYSDINAFKAFDDVSEQQLRRKTLHLLKRTVYTDVSFADVQDILYAGLCADDSSIGTVVLDLERRAETKHKSNFVEYPVIHKWYTKPDAVYADELDTYFQERSFCKDSGGLKNYLCRHYESMCVIDRTIVPVQEQGVVTSLMCIPQAQSKTIVSEALKKFVMGSITAYRASLTEDLFYTLRINGCNLKDIKKIEVDYVGHLYINDCLVNYKISLGTLNAMLQDEYIWYATLGVNRTEFVNIVKQHWDDKDAGIYPDTLRMQTICNILQEQHIPRWGFLFDMTRLNDLTHLQTVIIANTETWVRCLYVNTLNIADMLKKWSVVQLCGYNTQSKDVMQYIPVFSNDTDYMDTVQNFIAYTTCTYNIDVEKIRRYVLIRNQLRKKVGLFTEKVLDNRKV